MRSKATDTTDLVETQREVVREVRRTVDALAADIDEDVN